MAHRTSRRFSAFSTLVLAGLLAGCGDDLGKLIPQDGASRADAVAPLRPEVQTPRPDAPPASTDQAAEAPAGTRDAAVAESGGGAGVEAGGETSPGFPGLDAGAGPETPPPPPPATIVVLPDTQYYASTYPDVFASQTTWILNQKTQLDIAAVLHVGDIVDGASDPNQWHVADTSMRVLDGIVPYVLVPGNHDTDAGRNTPIDTYFPPDSMPWITGTMTLGQIENNYAVVDIGPQKWLIVGIEFGPRDAVVTWADSVLKAYPNNPAILVTHAYLYHDGSRYDINVSGTDSSKPSYQSWIPQYYGYTASQGINDGEMLWQKLVLPNRNVRLVFCGHDTGAARLTSARPDGSLVYQMLSDYQWFNINDANYYGGGGYLRVLRFDFGKKNISVQTYSPYLQQYLDDDANQFSLDMNF